MPEITHSFVMAVLESYAMVGKQCAWLDQILPENWELLIVDDGSEPAIKVSGRAQVIRHEPKRQAGEWTQKEALNLGIAQARGEYFIKSDVDHVFTREAIQAADAFRGDMLLFHRKAGVFNEDLTITPLENNLTSPADDIFVMKTSLFTGYPQPRVYGGGGAAFWHLSKRPEAQPLAGALIYAVPNTHEQYHGLNRVHRWQA